MLPRIRPTAPPRSPIESPISSADAESAYAARRLRPVKGTPAAWYESSLRAICHELDPLPGDQHGDRRQQQGLGGLLAPVAAHERADYGRDAHRQHDPQVHASLAQVAIGAGHRAQAANQDIGARCGGYGHADEQQERKPHAAQRQAHEAAQHAHPG